MTEHAFCIYFPVHSLVEQTRKMDASTRLCVWDINLFVDGDLPFTSFFFSCSHSYNGHDLIMINQPTNSATPSLPTPETFPFPYPKPYDIQLDLMRVVFRAIEDGKIAIVSLNFMLCD